MRPMTDHARERQVQRGIKRNHIQLCVRKGTRTNIPNGDPTNRWRHKYMYHGLHVVCNAQDGTVITAYWCAKEGDGMERGIEHCIAAYDELLKNEYGRAENRKKTTKTTQKQERAGRTESYSFAF